jgi:hypothetical protein
MSSTELCRILKKAEAKYRYWRISKEERDFFPPENIEFEVEFVGKTSVLKVSPNNLVITSQFYEQYRFLENDRIILTKKKENIFIMNAPDTKLWPEIKQK